MQVAIGQRYTARSPLIHASGLVLDVDVEQVAVISGVSDGEKAGATAVFDVGGGGLDHDPFQGDAEVHQVAPLVTVGCPGGSQLHLQLILLCHGLQGLQEEERTELALSWREHRSMTYLLFRNTTNCEYLGLLEFI